MKFYISDPHFFHKNIIRYDNRPFSDMDDMIAGITERWNKAVKKKDEVYILGDLFFIARDADRCAAILESLHGTKYLITGNHEDGLKKEPIIKQLEWIKPLDYIKDYRDGNPGNKEDGNLRRVMLCHYPMETWCERGYGSYMLYGHIHSQWGSIRGAMRNRYNVSCCVLDYTPRTLDQLIEADLDFKNKPDSPRDAWDESYGRNDGDGRNDGYGRNDENNREKSETQGIEDS